MQNKNALSQLSQLLFKRKIHTFFLFFFFLLKNKKREEKTDVAFPWKLETILQAQNPQNIQRGDTSFCCVGHGLAWYVTEQNAESLEIEL